MGIGPHNIPILTVVVFGLGLGGVYALMSLGISLVYKTARTINFAQGEIGTFSVYVTWWLISNTAHTGIVAWIPHLTWLEGAAIALVVAGAVGYVTHLVVAWPMRNASRLSLMVATLGVSFLLFGMEAKIFGPSPEILPPPLQAIGSFTGIKVQFYKLSLTYVMGLAAATSVALVLAILLNRTRFGLGVLATAQDAAMARLLGIPASRVSAFVWTAAAVLGAISGLLAVPSLYAGTFAAFLLSGPLFFRGLVGSLIGGLGSLSGAIVGAVIVGEVDSFTQFGFGIGYGELFLLGIVLVLMVIRPQGLFAQKAAIA